jgi:hypothetical protein
MFSKIIISSDYFDFNLLALFLEEEEEEEEEKF